MTGDVIGSLWLRQLKRYVRSRARIVGALGQPLLFLVALGFGFGPVYRQAGHGDYIQFLAPGIIAMSTLFTAIFSGTELIWDRQFGYLKATFVAPVSRRDIMVGRTLGGATVAVVQASVVAAACVAVGFRPSGALAVAQGLVFVVLIAVLFTAAGTVIASRLEDFHGFQLVITFVVMPVFFLSGALFPLVDVPRPLRIAAQLDPLSYGVDGLRAALTGAAYFEMATDVAVLSVLSVILIGLGAHLFSRIQL